MRGDRRNFVVGAGALLATASTAGIALAAGGPGPPRTKARFEDFFDANARELFTCVQTAETVEGPFYYPSSLERRNLAENRAGVKLRLGLTISGNSFPGLCAPLTGALVDVWHTDAGSLYSNVGADLQYEDAVGKTFCRGHQLTDDKGYVEFDTVVPGWEVLAVPPMPPGAVLPPGLMPPGGAPPPPVLRRATHIHVKIFKDHSVANMQLYLPDPFLAELYAGIEPYRSHRLLSAPGVQGTWERVANTEDAFFSDARATPMAIQRKGDWVLATARIGVTFENSHERGSLWR